MNLRNGYDQIYHIHTACSTVKLVLYGGHLRFTANFDVFPYISGIFMATTVERGQLPLFK